MVPTAIWLVLLLSLLLVVNQGVKLARNVQLAKSTGLKYVIAPYYSYNRITSLFCARYILKYVDKVWPDPAFSSWRFLVRNGRPWKYPYAPFAQLGTDTFLLVAPGGIVLHTADADVISQISARDKDFPKATWLYTSVSIYGQNVVSSEGAVWRHHRRLTAPAFTEKNNRLVWDETLEQAQGMLDSWSSSGRNRTVDNVAGDTMQLSLNVINHAGFGKKTSWHTSSDETAFRNDVLTGHMMTFAGSLKHLLKNILTIMILPKPFLKYIPNARLNKCYTSYSEWGQYMREMIQAKKAELETSKSERTTVDLLGNLVKGQETDYEGTRLALADSQVMGNIFVMMIGGHETSANSIHFSLLFLALNPSVQRSVQKELDSIFGTRPISSWSYDSDLPKLQTSLLAAVLHEQLRLIAPAINIPKMTHTPQTLTIASRPVTLPKDMMIRLCVHSVHQHPSYWPRGPASPTFPRDHHPHWTQTDDLDEFKPSRWLNPEYQYQYQHQTDKQQSSSLPTTNPESESEPDSSPFYTPPRGAYIPFSDGPRACLGRRFAQVEILSALAVILRSHSVELGVDEFASDAEIQKMDDDEARKQVWRRAEEQAWWKLKNAMKCVITVQMAGRGVGMRFVERGGERFAGL